MAVCPRCNGQRFTTHTHADTSQPKFADEKREARVVRVPCDVCVGSGERPTGEEKEGWEAIVDVLQKAGLD